MAGCLLAAGGALPLGQSLGRTGPYWAEHSRISTSARFRARGYLQAFRPRSSHKRLASHARGRRFETRRAHPQDLLQVAGFVPLWRRARSNRPLVVCRRLRRQRWERSDSLLGFVQGELLHRQVNRPRARGRIVCCRLSPQLAALLSPGHARPDQERSHGRGRGRSSGSVSRFRSSRERRPPRRSSGPRWR
jgi:hypothetical protein